MACVRKSRNYRFSLCLQRYATKPTVFTELKTLLDFFEKRIIKYYFISSFLFFLALFLIKPLHAFQKKRSMTEFCRF